MNQRQKRLLRISCVGTVVSLQRPLAKAKSELGLSGSSQQPRYQSLKKETPQQTQYQKPKVHRRQLRELPEYKTSPLSIARMKMERKKTRERDKCVMAVAALIRLRRLRRL
jgi:hypothetical protein